MPSKYAGMNEKRNIILSMAIAGALSALAGGLLYLAGSGKHIVIEDALASEGFTGISVALLGLSKSDRRALGRTFYCVYYGRWILPPAAQFLN